MKWTEVNSGNVYAAGHQFFTALGDRADAVIARINSDPSFVYRLAKFSINGGFEPTTSQKRARAIMGENFFGVEEAIQHFGVKSTQEQLSALAEIPFTEKELRKVKDTHILVAVFPMSLLGIRKKVPKLFYGQDWYNSEKFATDSRSVSWQFVRKTPVSSSFSKNWEEQQSLISKDDEVPTAQVMVYAIIGHFLATGKRLFERVYVRTSDVSSSGYRVCVGSFGSGGRDVYDYWDDYRGGSIGLASARKFNPLNP